MSRHGFTVSSGVLGLLHSAGSRNEDYKHFFNGDLCQMSKQEDFLRGQNFDVGRNDVYPCVRTQEEFDRAIKLIYDREVEGWWHYDKRLVEIGHCTQEQFRTKLDTYCARKREQEERDRAREGRR